MTISRHLAAVAVTALTVFGLTRGAEAAEAYISGTIFWGATSPTTAYSIAGEESGFSFDVNAAIPATNQATGGATTYDITNFEYTLNNKTTGIAPITSITFWPSIYGGGFDMNFGPTNNNITVSISSADIGNIGSGINTINMSNFYALTASINDGVTAGNGGISVSVSSVPLPAALPMFSAGLAAIGFAAWRRKAA
jgi:hypothetical protein